MPVALPGPAMTTGDAFIIIMIMMMFIIIIKPLLKIFNECRSLTAVGELGPY